MTIDNIGREKNKQRDLSEIENAFLKNALSAEECK